MKDMKIDKFLYLFKLVLVLVVDLILCFEFWGIGGFVLNILEDIGIRNKDWSWFKVVS